MSAEDRMIHRVSIERRTAGAENEYGEPSETWAAASSNVPAAIVTKSAREMASLAQGGAVTSSLSIDLPIGTSVTEADRILHDADSCPVQAPLELPTRRYQLSFVRDASSAGLFLRCDAEGIA